MKPARHGRLSLVATPIAGSFSPRWSRTRLPQLGIAARLARWLLLLCAALTPGSLATLAEDSPPLFRTGFSSSMFVDVNESDAKIFLRVWVETFAKKKHIAADPRPVFLDGIPALQRALQHGEVDAATMTTREFLGLDASLQRGPVLLPVVAGKSTEEYVVLVRTDGPIKEISDLRGRSIICWDHPRASLAPLWLDTVLAQQGLGSINQCFGKVIQTKKPSQSVLSVFFRQVDVSLASRTGFQLAAELNPQVGRQLRVLATSPALVHHLFCLRPDLPSERRTAVLNAGTTMHETPSGQQMQTTFKVDRLAEHPLSSLDPARELLALHQQLFANPGKSAP